MPQPFDQPIYVTRPSLPPFDEFCAGLREIWDSRWLTNNGPVLQRFTRELGQYYETDNLCLFNNGTLALQIALQGLGVSGEAITTPFTFVATTHALYWNKVRPVFVDIEPETYTLDPDAVEAAITPWTTAILAVHTYGHPCRLGALADIARRRGLLLIYDAAHAFGVRVGDRSIAHYGDLSMFSFHATKPYHSIEGGMLIFQAAGLKKTFDYLKNFGFENETEVVMPGTNAKMNELQALMGSLMLRRIEEQIARRAALAACYRARLAGVAGLGMPPPPAAGVRSNHAYFPLEIDAAGFGADRDAVYAGLKRHNIFARRYFYPLLCDYACYRGLSIQDPLTAARHAAERILTLPLYEDLAEDDIDRVCDILLSLRGGG